MNYQDLYKELLLQTAAKDVKLEVADILIADRNSAISGMQKKLDKQEEEIAKLQRGDKIWDGMYRSAIKENSIMAERIKELEAFCNPSNQLTDEEALKLQDAANKYHDTHVGLRTIDAFTAGGLWGLQLRAPWSNVAKGAIKAVNTLQTQIKEKDSRIAELEKENNGLATELKEALAHIPKLENENRQLLEKVEQLEKEKATCENCSIKISQLRTERDQAYDLLDSLYQRHYLPKEIMLKYETLLSSRENKKP